MKKTYIVILLFILPFCVKAQFVLNTSGNWVNGASWQGGVPASSVSDDVTMNDNISVTIQGADNITAGNITTGMGNTVAVQNGGNLQFGDATHVRSFVAGTNMSITVQNNGTIIIWGDLTVSNSLAVTIFGPNGKIIVKGNVLLADNATLNVTGDLEVDGNFTGGMSTSVLVQPGGSINVGGTLTVGPGSFFHSACSSGTAPTGVNCGTFHAHQCGPDPDSQAFCTTAGLPVELIFFRAQTNLSSVGFTWATASELNLDYFLVEKSSDGTTFQEIAKVTGSGTSRQRLDYATVDEKPTSGISYYRLTEFDLDRSAHHLKLIQVNFTGAKTLSIFPNPITDGRINFELNFVPENKVLVSIVDLRGVTMAEFEINQQSLTLPVQLTSGIYVVTMRSESQKAVSKLVVR